MKKTPTTDFADILFYKKGRDKKFSKSASSQHTAFFNKVMDSAFYKSSIAKMYKYPDPVEPPESGSKSYNPVGNDIFYVYNEVSTTYRDYTFDLQRSIEEMDLIENPEENFSETRRLAIENAEGGFDQVDVVEGIVLLPGLPHPVQHCWLASQHKRIYIDPVLTRFGFTEGEVKYFPGCYIPETIYYFMNRKKLYRNIFIYPLLNSPAYNAHKQMFHALTGCIRYAYIANQQRTTEAVLDKKHYR